MPKTRQQKEEQVRDLTDKLSSAKSVVFADYRGLTMKQLSGLRDKLRDQKAEFTITKNTLLKRAKKDLDFEGPTAALFAYDDEISPIKILVKVLKDTGIGSIKAGFFEGQLQDQELIVRLAMLPTKIELYAKIVGVLSSPLYGLHLVLGANLRNLVYAVSQINENRSAFAKTSADKEGGV